MESHQIKTLFIVVLAAVFAVYLGVAAATAQFEALAWVGGFVAVAIILALGRSVWILIPVGLALQGTINAIPGSPPAWALAAAVTATMFVIRFAMRKPDFVFRWDLLDLAVLCQVLVIAQAYLRNPTGLMMFGGSVVGGKSYFIFAAAVVAYYCVAFVKPQPGIAKWLAIIMIVIAIGDGLVSTISDWSASFAHLILPIYSNVNLAAARAGSVATDLSETRGGGGFMLLGRALVFPCFCLLRPIHAISPFRPVILLTVLVGSGLMLLSGFRSGVAYLVVVYVVSALVRKKVIDSVVVALAGFLGLAILLMSGKLQSLPFGVQRVLSVLPVEVSSAAKSDAENSTRWRVEMWKLALGTDRYIQDKVLGDGFALSGVEMRYIMDASQGIQSLMDDSQERMLAQGSYHGFHVETIRFTGAVGLLAALFLMAVAFRKALQLLSYYRGKPGFGYYVYLCLPFLIYPFWSMLVFGAYRVEFPQYIAMAGILKLLENLRLSEATALETVPEARTGRLPLPAYAVARRGRA